MKLFLVFLISLIGLNSLAGDTTKLYNPYADVARDVAQALAQAKKEKSKYSYK